MSRPSMSVPNQFCAPGGRVRRAVAIAVGSTVQRYGAKIAAKTITASYLRDDGSVGAAVVSDIEVAAFAGAALALIPKGVANDCVKDGELTEMLADNFHEVLNVASAWFNGKGAPHVSLGEVTDPGGRPAQTVQAVVANHAERADFEVEVDGYGKGVLRFLSVAY